MLVVVVGAGGDQVSEHVESLGSPVTVVVQEPRGGTGHAVRLAMQALDPESTDGVIVVVSGDSPLIKPETLARLVSAQPGHGAVLLTALVADPTGFGRIIRSSEGDVERIVEEKDASETERGVQEVNSGTYAFDGVLLRQALNQLTTENAQGEEYLTDVVAILRGQGERIAAVTVDDEREVLGINDRSQLAICAQVIQERINLKHMLAGVSIIDPSSTWIDSSVSIGPDVVLHPGTSLRGATVIARGAEVGPRTTLVDCVVGEGAVITESTCVKAQIGAAASVGPYTYLRPGTVLGRSAKAGAFVEIKASTIGDESKVPHLSYVGDAIVGVGTNIGAATVIVNYDGLEKHQTVIGDHVRIGSDTMLVAPVSVGDGAYTAAGSVITDDVPPGAMGVGRSRQRNIVGWVLRKRPGTSSARAVDRQSAAVSEASETGTV